MIRCQAYINPHHRVSTRPPDNTIYVELLRICAKAMNAFFGSPRRSCSTITVQRKGRCKASELSSHTYIEWVASSRRLVAVRREEVRGGPWRRRRATTTYWKWIRLPLATSEYYRPTGSRVGISVNSRLVFGRPTEEKPSSFIRTRT